MRADLGFIPALWADNGDLVLVDDVEAALDAGLHIKKNVHDVRFITLADLKNIESAEARLEETMKYENYAING